MRFKQATGIVIAMILSFAAAPHVQAHEEPTPGISAQELKAPEGDIPNISLDDYQELDPALKDDGAVAVGDGLVSYKVEGFGELILREISEPLPGGTDLQSSQVSGKPGADLWAGGGIRNPYISFNRVDQSALLAGGSVVLGAAICSASPPACAAASTLIAIATTYVISYGRCSTAYPNLRLYIWSRTVTGCYR